MIRVLKRFSLFVFLLNSQAIAGENKAGDFDYYVLALSWNASWCAEAGDDRGADQCHPKHDHGFLVHGLWPQYEDGWPSYCRTTYRDPSRRQTKAMSDVMGSGGSAWHQWKKHGRCSGISSDRYFDLVREAYAKIERPSILRKVDKTLRIDPTVIEEAYLQSNNAMKASGITVTCKQGRIQEVRICLTKDLQFRSCGRDVSRDCTLSGAIFPPMR